MHRSAVIWIAAALLLSVPASAFGSPGWVAGRGFPLPAEATAGASEVLYQSGGTATEAFVHFATLTPPYVPSTVHVGVVPPGGAYEDQLVISSTASTFPVGVKIAVAPDGAAVATWAEALGSANGPDSYRAAYRPTGSDTWEAPFTIATDEEAGGSNLVTVIGAGGAAAVGVEHLASKEKGGGGQTVQRIDVAVRPASGSWSSQRISPAATSTQDLSLAVDAEGDLSAAYQQRYLETTPESNDRYHVVTRRLPASSDIWGPAEELTSASTTSAYSVHLAENESGAAVISWQLDDFVAKTLNSEAVTRQGANGSWIAAAPIVTGGSSSNPLAAGVAPDGTAYVLYWYTGNSSGEDCIGAVRAPVLHAFSAQKCVSPVNEDGFSGSVAFLASDAYLAWTAIPPGESSKKTVQAARWADGSVIPEAATNLDVPGLNYSAPTLTPDGMGSMVAFYSLYSGESGQLRAAAYDASPPILLSSAIPTTATAGVPVTFDASFVDLWSALSAGQPTWGFGDGSALAAGASVTHTFAKAGTYTITLTASDALGNAASSTYTIGVSPSPVSRPSVTLNYPSCKKKLSKAACRRHKRSTGTWRTLSGTASDASSMITKVQVAVYRIHRKHLESLRGGRFHKSTMKQAARTFVSVAVEKGRWSLRLPKLTPGAYTILVRATDAAGQEAQLIAKMALK